jgi:hypothetical protein
MSPRFKLSAFAAFAAVLSFSAASAQTVVCGDDVIVPTVITHPQGATLVGEDETYTLFVEVATNSGAELYYTWMVSPDEDKRNAKPVSSGLNVLSVSNPGATLYYYAVVTVAMWNNCGNLYKTAVESNVAKVVGTQRLNAVAPIISGNPQNESTIVGKNLGLGISVLAVAVDGGMLSYQWFSNADRADTAGWVPIEGATGASYQPDVGEAGTTYYRVVVTNTNNAVAGNKTASRTSYASAVRVEEPGVSYAAFPTVSELKSAAREGDSAALPVLSIDANSSDGGTLSYQWYRTSYESDVGGEPVKGATDQVFDPSRDDAAWAEAVYYYVEVTNTKSAGGDALTAVATSAPARAVANVTVITAVKTGDRVVPRSERAGEVAVITPAKSLTAGFTAGPNPVKALRATPVQFFRQGSRVESASLSVYDASGNIVTTVKIEDSRGKSGSPVVSTQSRRVVGTWDLTDKKGRTVPGGTYLVKGTVRASGGKAERVSVVVGVR